MLAAATDTSARSDQMTPDPAYHEKRGEPLRPRCEGCLRLQHLVDEIIKGSIDFLVTLKFGNKAISTDQYAIEFEKASFVFIQHLRDHGFLPKKIIAPGTNGKDVAS